jgi:hypothetical protein
MENHLDQIQCVVGSDQNKGYIPFGKSQQPALWDYADGADTIAFVTSIS